MEISDLHQCVKEKEKDVDMKILQVTLPKSYSRKHCFPLYVYQAKVKKHSYIIIYYNIKYKYHIFPDTLLFAGNRLEEENIQQLVRSFCMKTVLQWEAVGLNCWQTEYFLWL